MSSLACHVAGGPPDAGDGLALHLQLPRAATVTDALLDPGGASVGEEDVERLRAVLRRGLDELVASVPAGARVEVDGYRAGLALHDPDACSADDRFTPSPSTCRRAVGNAAVERSLRSGMPPAAAVADVLAEAVAADGGASPPWWARWVATLGPAALAVVQAEAIGHATDLWTALDWRRLGPRVAIGGPARRWECRRRGRLVLKGTADVTVWAGDRPAALVVGTGAAPADWRVRLGWPALVAAAAHGARATPRRVVGVWPASGQIRILPVDSGLLDDMVGDAVVVAAVWVAAFR